MTDQRMGDALWTALGQLPRGSGVIFRHYATRDRRALFERVRAVARKRRLVLVLAGTPRQAVAWRADGAHGRSPHRRAARPLLPCPVFLVTYPTLVTSVDTLVGYVNDAAYGSGAALRGRLAGGVTPFRRT